MNITQAISMAFSSITSNKMRSFLTMLGIIIGVLSVTLLVSISESSTSEVTSQLTSLGTDMLIVSVNSPRDIHLELEDLEVLEGNDGIRRVAPVMSAGYTAKAGIKTYDVTVYGTTAGYADIRNLTIEEGRFMTDLDSDNRTAVCTIGVKVADELFGTRNVLGEFVSIGGRKFQIVGLFEEEGQSLTGSIDEEIYIPFTTAQRMFKRTAITNFYVGADDASAVPRAELRLSQMLFSKTGDEDDYSIINQNALLDTLNSVTGTLTLMLGAIAGIALLVGGIGIMNIMLVSVTERTREIGIRKALGAKRKDIMTQFLIEALVLSLSGGLIGLGVGYLAIGIYNRLAEFVVTISPAIAVIAIGFSVFVGLIFGLYPADKASKLRPIEALRYE